MDLIPASQRPPMWSTTEVEVPIHRSERQPAELVDGVIHEEVLV